jgi:hypothetical protein
MPEYEPEQPRMYGLDEGEEQFGQLHHEPYSSCDIVFSFPNRKQLAYLS